MLTFSALLYVMLVTPTYQVEVVLKPVTSAALLPLNQPILKEILVQESLEKIQPPYITPDDAFARSRMLLRSSSTLHDFYKTLLTNDRAVARSLIYTEALTDQQNFLRFSERFSFKDPGPKEGDGEFNR